MAERVRVLSIDGGGIRGIIPALVLVELERLAGRRTFELFDLIAGTSTGGILACALCAPDPMPASQIVGLYADRGPDIFDRSLWRRIRSADGLLDERYDAGALDTVLRDFLEDKRLRETRPDLIVPSYDTAAPGPYFFKTRNAREGEDEDFPLSIVARATSAAPTYFEPLEAGARSLVDGGVFAVNPGMCAYAELLRHHPGADPLLLSLGTGVRTRTRPHVEVRDWVWPSGRDRYWTWCSTASRTPSTTSCGRRWARVATTGCRWSCAVRATTSTTPPRRTSPRCASTPRS